MTACPRSGISPRVQFGGHESFEAGENKVDLLVGEVLVVVVVVMEVLVVVNIVGVVGAQREISFEYNIEAEALAEMVEEVEVEKKAEKEPVVVDVMELVGREPAFVDKNWRDLLVGPQSRVVLRTFFWQPLPHCPFSSSDLYWSSWVPAFSFWVYLWKLLLLLMMLVSLLMLVLLVILFFWVSVLRLLVSWFRCFVLGEVRWCLFGDPFFFRVTSVHSSWLIGWADLGFASLFAW